MLSKPAADSPGQARPATSARVLLLGCTDFPRSLSVPATRPAAAYPMQPYPQAEHLSNEALAGFIAKASIMARREPSGAGLLQQGCKRRSDAHSRPIQAAREACRWA